ncbi:hypothetical protein [Kribbella shirazensis]|uniref:Pimeloyl-ACP methyl ester carboxylesterase n=1 Tax=Kribbella shirazensis TaxID=1105143 RepID=A0A7X6A436_9ACTN|nr:hypothetical protein [Kribbella shirazensis]NIK60558.1 pimeloyl-ACP methyl ester carboxylesterase [Kribbella shirazensis]
MQSRRTCELPHRQLKAQATSRSRWTYGVARPWDVPVEQLVLTDEFGTTYANTCGPADGPPVVLPPGHVAASPVWFTIAPPYLVYAIDLIIDPVRSPNTSRTPTTPGRRRASRSIPRCSN